MLIRKIPVLLIAFCCLAHHAKSFQGANSLITVNVDLSAKAQTIENIGASGCWFSEGIGKYWPVQKKEAIARLLFSRQSDKQGRPSGIGLSAWRFNIGAGTAEQGDSSGIKDFRKRTECFLNPDGTYNWNKQAGYQYFLQQAHHYGVKTLIAFSNSPPVKFTQNGLGYKIRKDYTSNLRPDAYNDYAKFLVQVARHFQNEGIHFSYISPVNEPQWDWAHPYMQADQEGSPWKNEETYKIVGALNAHLSNGHLNTKILITEAGALNYLYQGSSDAASQIQHFFDPKSPLSLIEMAHVPALVAGHSYFTESDDSTLVNTRLKLADTAKKYGVHYWQTEYSMLGNGYKEGATGQRSAIDCALFLAKVIHTDLTVGNATAWQFWNAYEPGSADKETRYYLIALNPNPDFKDGSFTPTKNLWALGHYSLFVRPGMKRVLTQASSTTEENKKLLVSAWTDHNEKLVIVAVNQQAKAVKLKLNLQHVNKIYRTSQMYLTTVDKESNLKPMPVKPYSSYTVLPARSISTIVIN